MPLIRTSVLLGIGIVFRIDNSGIAKSILEENSSLKFVQSSFIEIAIVPLAYCIDSSTAQMGLLQQWFLDLALCLLSFVENQIGYENANNVGLVTYLVESWVYSKNKDELKKFVHFIWMYWLQWKLKWESVLKTLSLYQKLTSVSKT